MTSTSGGPDIALRMLDVSKSFPGVQALDHADLVVATGEIHGLVGENGAGKSTLIKVLAGVYEADGGSVAVGGTDVDHLTPQAIHDLGVRFIHQEVNLVPHFTVAESVFLGQEPRGRLGIDNAAMRRRAEDFLGTVLGADISGKSLVRDLTVARRKLVQIARALIDGEARLIVFDEPTAVLGAEDIEVVFEAIRGLRSRGISMVYVSHYLSEISEICDRVTVFRNGADVGTIDLGESTDIPEVIRLMVGREITEMYPDRSSAPGAPILDVSELGDGQHFEDVSFTVRAGEIVGLAGIIGSGREELVESIYGARRARTGTTAIEGQRVRLRSPADSVDRGLVLVPRDRRNDGLVLDMTVGDNINLATLDEVGSAGWLNRRAARRRADDLVTRLDVRPPRSDRVVRYLSGGNQQKVVLARWLASGPRLFLLDDPTVGVDVGARSEIYKLIGSLVGDQSGVLLSSNDLGELLGMCDRILVLVRGRIVADVDAADTSLDDLVALTTGSNGEVGA